MCCCLGLHSWVGSYVIPKFINNSVVFRVVFEVSIDGLTIELLTSTAFTSLVPNNMNIYQTATIRLEQDLLLVFLRILDWNTEETTSHAYYFPAASNVSKCFDALTHKRTIGEDQENIPYTITKLNDFNFMYQTSTDVDGNVSVFAFVQNLSSAAPYLNTIVDRNTVKNQLLSLKPNAEFTTLDIPGNFDFVKKTSPTSMIQLTSTQRIKFQIN